MTERISEMIYEMAYEIVHEVAYEIAYTSLRETERERERETVPGSLFVGRVSLFATWKRIQGSLFAKKGKQGLHQFPFDSC